MTGERHAAWGLRRRRETIGAVLAVAFLTWTGCGGGSPHPSKVAGKPEKTAKTPSGKASGADAAVTTTDYTLKGVVVSVTPETGRVRIRHEEIPGFMPAMTMSFRPANESVLGLLGPGDHVEGVLHVESQYGAVRDHQLRDLKVTKPAPPKAMVLDTSRGKVQLRQQPPRLEAGEPVPDFTMTGQDGKPVKLSDLRGKVVVLTFVYTRCPMPEFCPAMDRRFSELAQHLQAFPKRAGHIRLVSVSFDPEHDTPEVLRKHAAMRGANPPLWSYAVASHEELARIAPRLGLFFGADGQEIAHNLCTAIIDTQGKLARLEVGSGAKGRAPADFLKTIYGLLPADAK